MNIKQTIRRIALAHGLLLVFGMAASPLLASTPVSAASTTWQKFVEKKCSSGSADATERCAANLTSKLKAKCGPEKKNDTYIACWRKFIKDNGGTAGPKSSPFETEKAPVAPTTDPANPIAGNDCGGVQTAIIKCDATNSGDTEDNGIWALLLLVLNILTAGVGIIAVGGIVYGSILYTTAEDKADQVKKATDIITNVVIGLVLFALMYGLLNFIVPGGVFA